MFFCRHGVDLFVVQDGLKRFGETSLEVFVGAAVGVRCCCCFGQVRVPVTVVPGERGAEIVSECVDGCIAAGERGRVCVMSV